MLTFPRPDDLMHVYYDLCLTQNIPDIKQYSDDWLALADMFDAEDRPNMAAMCRIRGEWYGRETGTEYVRIIEQPFAELLEVPA